MLVPVPVTFSVTPAMVGKQYSEHVYKGHFFGRLIDIAMNILSTNLTLECFWSQNITGSDANNLLHDPCNDWEAV